MGASAIAGGRRGTRPARPRRPCPGSSERELFRRSRAGSVEARDELARRYLPLARGIAMRYRGGAEPVDDLVQVASVGLVKALARFDPDRGVAFRSYAVPTIVGELKRHLRDTRWAAYVPQRMRAHALEVDRAAEALRRALKRSPTVHEVARAAGLEPAAVAEALRAATAFDALSLDAPPPGARDPDAAVLAELVGCAEERYELVEHAAAIDGALRSLPPRQRTILRLRFREDLTQAQIAARLGISQMHVSRLLRQALERLRKRARAEHGQRGRYGPIIAG